MLHVNHGLRVISLFVEVLNWLNLDLKIFHNYCDFQSFWGPVLHRVMVDYSRFDRVGDECCGDDSDFSELKGGSDEARGSSEGCEGGQNGLRRIGKMASTTPDGRIKFEYQGRTVYEWEQSLDDVNIYIAAPPGVRSHNIACKIMYCRVTLGVKGNPPFIDVGLSVRIDGSDISPIAYWFFLILLCP